MGLLPYHMWVLSIGTIFIGGCGAAACILLFIAV